MRSWTTAASDDGDSVSYWKEAICEAIFELDFNSADHDLRAQLSQHDLGILKVSDVPISCAHQVERSRQAAAREQSPLFNLNFIRHGKWQVDHCGKTAEIGSGDLVLLDSRRPYSVVAAAGTTHIAVHLPADWLRCWLPCPEDAVARPIGPASPWYSTLTATLAEVLLMHPEDAAMRTLCAQQIGGAVSLGFGEYARAHNSHTHGIYRRIMACIKERFCDHQLDASSVAREVNISPRYLHKILAQHSTTFLRELFAVRLEQARTMLENPLFAELSVSEIGWRCGFCDSSHFSRRFKLHFGQSPGMLRTASGTCVIN